MLAQALGEYGLLEGLSQGVVRLSNWADAWMGEWGVTALVVGGVVAGVWPILLPTLPRHRLDGKVLAGSVHTLEGGSSMQAVEPSSSWEYDATVRPAAQEGQ